VGSVLTRVFNELNAQGETKIKIDDSHAINLRLLPKHSTPPVVHSYQVPFPVRNIPSLITEEWDQTLQQVRRKIETNA
jgi:hypothetical protein